VQHYLPYAQSVLRKRFKFNHHFNFDVAAIDIILVTFIGHIRLLGQELTDLILAHRNHSASVRPPSNRLSILIIKLCKFTRISRLLFCVRFAALHSSVSLQWLKTFTHSELSLSQCVYLNDSPQTWGINFIWGSGCIIAIRQLSASFFRVVHWERSNRSTCDVPVHPGAALPPLCVARVFYFNNRFSKLFLLY